MQAINKIRDGGNCEACRAPVVEEALKCSKCELLCHLTCSGYPEYQLVRFASTRSQYLCRACTSAEESYERTMERVKRLLSLEADAVEAAAEVEEDKTPLRSPERVNDQLDDGSNTGIRNTAEHLSNAVQQESGATPTPENRKGVCKHYLTKSCKYGPKGVGCGFDHPRKCIRFMKHGDKSNRGCKKGKNCERAHPKLCWKARDEGVCDRGANCKFHHIKGTRTQRESNPGVSGLERAAPPNSSKPAQPVLRGRKPRVELRSEPRRDASGNDTGYHNHDDFLGLKNQMAQLQIQMQGLLAQLIPKPVNQSRTQCQCHLALH